MRITNTMMSSKFLSGTNDALARVDKYQSQVDSSKKINGIADDPTATSLTLQARDKLSKLAEYQSNVTTATSYLTEAETQASQLASILKSAYDDMVSANSGAKTSSDLNTIATELESLQQEMLGIGNTTLGTTYIFGGYNYTGSTNGVTKTAPFSTDGSGNLLYNNINLSQVSWQADFVNQTDAITTSGTGLEAQINSVISGFNTSDDEETNLKKASSVLSTLNDLVSAGNAALYSANQYGVSATSTNYTALKSIVDGLSSAATSLSSETSKDLVGDSGVTTNKFDSTSVQTILTTISGLFSGPPTLDSAISTLSGDVPAVYGTEMTDEAAKSTQIQVGTSETVDVTVTGLELFGTGSDNVYHILDKCIKMLKGDMTTDFGTMITALQNAQDNVLNVETKIGTVENRLTMLSDRYDTSKLNYTKIKSDAQDADIAEATTQLAAATAVYQAALAGGAKIMQKSLIDFLS